MATYFRTTDSRTTWAVRGGVGALLVVGACCAGLPQAHAERIVRGGRCSGELDGIELRGAVRLEHMAEPAWESISGNFRGRGSNLEFEAYLHEGTGTGRMWDTAAPQRATSIELKLQDGGFRLRAARGTDARFECQGL